MTASTVDRSGPDVRPSAPPARRMTVAQVTTLHPARDPRIFAKIARSVAAAGYDVVLIHPGGDLPAEEGVRFHGLALSGGRPRRMLLGTWRALMAGLRSGAPILQFHDPELLPAAFAWRLAGRQVIYDVHEDLPRDISIKGWIPKFLRPPVAIAAEAVEWVAGQLLSGVSAATEAIGARFPARHTVVVRNYPEDLERFRRPGTPYRERGPVVVYPGLLTAERGLGVMLQLGRTLPARLGARVVLAGRAVGSAAAALDSATREIPALTYRGALPREAVLQMYGEARVGLHLPAPLPHFLESLPIKLFEYMAAGIPVVVSDFPAWRVIIERVGCGLLVDPTDVEAVTRAVDQLLSDPEAAERMGQRGQRAVFAEFGWDGEAARLLQLYARLTGRVG